jgi:PKD repeat protein
MKKLTYLFILSVFAFVACEPYQDVDIELGAAASVPDFSIEYAQGDSNTIIVKDLSSGNFSRVWDFGENADGQSPLKQTSVLTVDTVTYIKAGTYTISLYVSAGTGGGTAQNSKTITVANDAVTGCTGTVALLTGDCLPSGRCWTFSQVAGAVTVGPSQGDGSWFTSTAAGLEADQYDDSFCFFLDNTEFQYNNNGLTINPFNGYAAESFAGVSDPTWTFSEGTGTGGSDQIILPLGMFLGVRDASNVYDILTISETELIVQAPIINEDGTPNVNNGWFELYFIAQ